MAFAIGEASVDVDLVPTDDGVAEGDETVQFVLAGGFGYEPGADPDDRATVIIHDGSPVVSVSAPDSAFEGGANGTFRFTRTGDLSSALTVTYSVTGTATPDDDYTALSGTVTFAPDQDSVDVALAPVDDSVVDPNELVTVAPD